MLAGDLTENTDPEMLTRCSQFFVEHGQYERAVELAALGKKVSFCLFLHSTIYTCLKTQYCCIKIKGVKMRNQFLISCNHEFCKLW